MPTAGKRFLAMFCQLLAPLWDRGVRDAQLASYLGNRLPAGLSKPDGLALKLLRLGLLDFLQDPCLPSGIVSSNILLLHGSGSRSYCVGCALGRWDIRMSIDSEEWLRARPNVNTLPDVGKVKQPAIPDSQYPIVMKWDGILVDDPGHSDDIVQRVRNVLSVIWGGNAETIEQEVCQILGVRELRDYFRRSGNDGFWMDHVRRYSKSRRKAPIYWLLQEELLIPPTCGPGLPISASPVPWK
jgi:hypothetical protein